MVKWKIDDAEDMPLAIIEDNDDGEGLLEIGSGKLKADATPFEVAVAGQLVREHNAHGALIAGCVDMLGDMPSLKQDKSDDSAECRFCGRVYDTTDGPLVECPDDDCPSFKAREAIKLAS